MHLDETDVQILRVLQENGRLSFRQIADKVKVSVPTVSSKIASLEKLGIIKGYSACLDPERLGEMSVMVSVRARPSHLRAVAERLAKDDHVRGAFLLSNCRILLSCTFNDPLLINDFVTSLGEVPEIIDYDVGSVIATIRDEPRAHVQAGISTVMDCAYCHERYRGEGGRVRLDSREYHVCCPTCAKALQEKHSRMKG